MVTVLIVDDHAMVREGLLTFLELNEGIEVIGEASNGQEAIALTKRLSPDIVLMDLVMPETDGIAATKAIRQQHPNTKVIALTSFGEEDRVVAAVRAGAAGYLLKNVSPPDLVRAIEDVYRGDVHLHPAIARTLVEQVTDSPTNPPPPDLTKRELEVLQLIANGFTNQDIAVELGIVVKTVKVHVGNILKKLGLADRTQAAVYAIRMGLVSDEPPTFMT
ncbi:MAG: response regulator transcription factor [Chloroflexota bacterium]